MKRDPRLRPLSARRSERRLHGLRFTPAGRLMRAMGMTTKHSQRLAGAYQDMAGKAEQARLAFLDHVLRPHAEQLARDLRSDLSLRGEAYVHVGWDDALGQPTHERIDPATIVPTNPQHPGHDWVRQRMAAGTHEHKPWAPPEHWRDLGEQPPS